jgi:glycosyltransferase involved in cell wall biosynthesis
MPEISVLMPVWNGAGSKEQYLRQAIQSILDQTFDDWELVIINDGSTDNTAAVLNEYAEKCSKIRVLTNLENLRIVKSLNLGIATCSAQLIARMDADDISSVTRLEVQKTFMEQHPELAMCGTSMYVINAEGKLEFEANKPADERSIKTFLKYGCAFVHGSVMYKKQVMEALGGYSEDPQYEYAEDYELWVRMAAKFPTANIPNRSLYYHRNHGTKSSVVFAEAQRKSTSNVINLAAKLLSV